LRSIRPGYLLVILSAFLFAAAGNAVKVLFHLGYAPLVLAQLRIGWAFAWLLLALLALRPALLRIRPADLPALTIFGCVGLAGVQLSYYLTIARLNIAVALLVQYLGLVAVAAFERFAKGRAVTTRVWSALVMVLVGAFFAVGAYQPSLLRVNLPGIIVGLISAAFFAFYLLRASALAQRMNTWTILVYGFGLGTVMWALYDAGTRTSLPSDLRIWAAMALIGLLGTLVAHGGFVLGLRSVRASSAGIVSTTEPVFAGLIAFLVLGDRLQWLQLLGASVIVAGVITVQLGERTRDAAMTPAAILP